MSAATLSLIMTSEASDLPMGLRALLALSHGVVAPMVPWHTESWPESSPVVSPKPVHQCTALLVCLLPEDPGPWPPI